MRLRLLAVGLGIALVGAGCTAGDDGLVVGSAEERLVAAVESTLGSRFAWELSVDADGEALDSLGDPSSSETLVFLDGFALSGVVDGQSASFAADVAGVEDIVEVRILGENAMYLRAKMDRIAGLMGEDLPDATEMAAEMAAEGIPDAIQQLIVAAFAGEWVGVTGFQEIEEYVTNLQAEMFSDGSGGAPSEFRDQMLQYEEQFRELFGDNPQEFLDRFAEVTETVENSVTRYDLAFDVQRLIEQVMVSFAEMMADPPWMSFPGSPPLTDGEVDEMMSEMVAEMESEVGTALQDLPATAFVTDGRLSRIEIDVVEIAQRFTSDVTGTLTIVATFTAADGGVAVPENATTIGGDEVTALIDEMMGDFPLGPGFGGDLTDEELLELFSELETAP